MITVCIATYNGERYIEEQLNSIIHQLRPTDEIVISDDGSSDNTLRIVQSIDFPNIRIITNKGEHGYTPNFENALQYSHGDYIFLSDQDDIWKENKVEVCMHYLEKYDFVVSDADIINAKGEIFAPSFYDIRHCKPGLINNLIRFSYLGCCIAFKRKILKKALPFPPNHTLCTHDNWLTLIGLTFFKSIAIKEKLISYRRYDGNTSSGGMRKTTTLLFKIRYRLYLIKWLLYRRFNYYQHT